MVARPAFGVHILPGGTLLLPAGDLPVSNPITLLPDQSIIGNERGTRLVANDPAKPLLEINGGTIENVELVGGSITANVRNEAADVSMSRVWIRGAGTVGLWLGAARKTRIENLVVESCGENGVQIQGAQDLKITNAVLLGPFGNKAFDCTHRIPLAQLNPSRVELSHFTVLDPHGYGIGVQGWRAGEGHVLANSLILERPTGAGASGYAAISWGQSDVGRFERNVASPTGATLQATFPGLADLGPRAFSDVARPDHLAGIFPNQFTLAIPENVGPNQRWPLLMALTPLLSSPLWIASPGWGNRKDILGNRRRLKRQGLSFAFAVGALG